MARALGIDPHADLDAIGQITGNRQHFISNATVENTEGLFAPRGSMNPLQMDAMQVEITELALRAEHELDLGLANAISAVAAVAQASGVSLSTALGAIAAGQGISGYSGALAATFGARGPIGTTQGNIYAGRGGGDPDAPTGAPPGVGQPGSGPAPGVPEAP
jgi:hypothetical protein